MKSQSKNRFRKIHHHLKSKQIDEKLEMLSEIPTNNISNYFVIEPDYYVQDPDIPGEVTREANFTQDSLANGRDTTGLFDDDGTILTIEPPGDTSYILGPMASMWYAWGNFTTIGYIRQADRRMVDLGRISGPLGSWNGSSGFTSYGQLTLEQAVWFKNTPKLNGASNDTPNYRAFYPGPPSNVADQYGRYLCVITGTTKSTTTTPPLRRVPPVLGGPDPNIPPGLANPNVAIDNTGGWLAAAAALGFVFKSIESFINWFNNQTPEMKEKLKELVKGKEIAGSLSGPRLMDTSSPIRPSPRGPYTPLKDYGSFGKPNFMPSGPSQDPWGGRGPLGPIPQVRKGGGPLVASYGFNGQLLSESRQRIIRDIKKPVVLPEAKKEKIKHRPRVIGASSKTINSDLMKKAEVPTSFKPMEEKLWGKYEKNQNARLSQERKNEVLDHLGGSDHAWEWLTETSKKKNEDIMYGHFGGKDKKVFRKEDVKGDVLLFISDETGKKERILQSELSIKLADEFNKELFEKYFQEQETLQADKDPLFKKVSSRLKPVIDYPDKPSKAGYPDMPPPEVVNGWHPEYGQKDAYYNKLDPQSAESMPTTGNPQIDAKVLKAKRIKQLVKGK